MPISALNCTVLKFSVLLPRSPLHSFARWRSFAITTATPNDYGRLHLGVQSFACSLTGDGAFGTDGLVPELRNKSGISGIFRATPGGDDPLSTSPAFTLSRGGGSRLSMRFNHKVQFNLLLWRTLHYCAPENGLRGLRVFFFEGIADWGSTTGLTIKMWCI